MVLVGKLYSVPVMRQTLVVRTCPVQCDHLLTYDRTRFEQIKATASVGGLEFEEPEYKHYEDNKKPEFIAKFPHGKIPALECTNGLHLTEGAAIARYRTYPIFLWTFEMVGWKEESHFNSYPCRNSMSTDSGISDLYHLSFPCA